MAPFGLKLWENAFQMIPDISFFDVEKKKWRKFSIKFSSKNFFDGKSTNCLFLRSYGFLDVIGRCASKSYPQSFDVQLSTTFGGGVKEIVSIFAPDFRPNMTSRLMFFWLEAARPDVAYQETIFLETTFEIRFQEKQVTVCVNQPGNSLAGILID